MHEVSTELVNAVELDLLLARKTGEVVAYVVRYGEHHTEGLASAEELVDRLRARGLTITVRTARADNGFAVLLEEAPPDPVEG